MIKLLSGIVLGLGVLAATTAFAAEKTVTLTVQNMDCAACPIIVSKSLQSVPGVTRAVVSYEDKTAIVTYEDSKTELNALITATTNAGYPSAPQS